MKKIILFIIVCFAILPLTGKSQCKEFTEKEALPLLGNFVISGRYNAVKLIEGDEILVFKTLNKGLTYRFVVKGSSELPKNIEFEIRGWEGELIYTNKNSNYASVWDYNCTKTQRVKIFVRVIASGKSKEPVQGCVALVTGIKK